MVGLTGLDHLDGLEQAGALDERALARDVDLGEVRDEPLAALARPALGAVELHVGRVEVLLRAVALGADTDDGYGAGLLVTVRSYRSAGTLRRLQALDPTGEKARAVKARYVGVCRGCGAYTPAAQRQGRRLRLLQGLPPRSDRVSVDRRAGARRDGRLARPLRAAAIVIRLVAHPRASTWGRGGRTPRRRASGLRRVSSPACSARGAPPARWLRSGLGR